MQSRNVLVSTNHSSLPVMEVPVIRHSALPSSRTWLFLFFFFFLKQESHSSPPVQLVEPIRQTSRIHWTSAKAGPRYVVETSTHRTQTRSQRAKLRS